MNYLNPTEFELVIGRVHPIPKQAQQLKGKGLTLERASRFKLTAPTAEFGPVKTAGERVRKLLGDHCGADCFGGAGAIPVKLSLGKAPFEMTCEDEGYSLTVTAKGIEIVGFGENGLLYGVITLEQLCKWDVHGCALPAVKIVDWPDHGLRGLKEESRWGSDMMKREEWMALLEDMVSKKMNFLTPAIYGCWGLQYDGQVSEYIYLPLKNHPEIKTFKYIKYWSPTEGRWVQSKKLPPIYEENLLDDIFRRARDLGIQVAPGWNSYGHNTLLPTMVPEVSAKNENGEPELIGFCTSNPATYELLFSIYDQIIDDYMIPYGMTAINLCLDEVHASGSRNPKFPEEKHNPWCACPACKGKNRGDTYIDHAIKLIDHLKKRGIKSVIIACDMLRTRTQRGLDGMENMPERLMAAVKAAGLQDTLLLDWWSYHDYAGNTTLNSMSPELGLRGVYVPWNGYHHWILTLNPIENVRRAASIINKDNGEGMYAYSMWDRSADRTHDAIADYTWNFDAAGAATDVTRRYALRHFGPRAHEAFRAFRMMDWCTEERQTVKFSVPDGDHISNWDLLSYKLSPYFFVGIKKDRPYPRAFVDDALTFLLTMRNDVERTLYSVSAMAKDAKEIFLSLAADSRCDHMTALRQAYECENYQVLVEDWLAILEIHDLSQSDACPQEEIARIALARQQARLDLMARCEQVKERCVMESMAMRQHSIFLQLFTDIADYVRRPDHPKLDLLNDAHAVLSDTAKWLR